MAARGAGGPPARGRKQEFEKRPAFPLGGPPQQRSCGSPVLHFLHQMYICNRKRQIRTRNAPKNGLGKKGQHFPWGTEGFHPGRLSVVRARARIGAKPPGGAPLSLSPAERPDSRHGPSRPPPPPARAGVSQYSFIPAGTARASRRSLRGQPGASIRVPGHAFGWGYFGGRREGTDLSRHIGRPGGRGGKGGIDGDRWMMMAAQPRALPHRACV